MKPVPLKCLFALLLAVAAASCSRQPEPRYRIGVSQCSEDDWRDKMNREMERELMLHPDIAMEVRSAHDDNARQIADLEYFADNGFDLVVVAPNEAAPLTPHIEELHRRGIPVVVFDRRTTNDTCYTAFQGADDLEIGRRAAQYVAHYGLPSANVVEIKGLEGSTPTHGRSRGFHEIADARPGINVVASETGLWNKEDAARVARRLLEAHPEANVIYAHNDRMAIGAAEVARQMGREVKVIGIDAAPKIGIQAVADSVIDATFLYPTEGERLIRTAVAILEGRPYAKSTILPTPSVVDHSNADILLLQNEQINDETGKILALKGLADQYLDAHKAQSRLFYATIAILVLLGVLTAILYMAFRSRKNSQAALEEKNRQLRQRARQVEEATQSKLAFFTNVSHDLRTPLTLVAEPVRQLRDAPNLTTPQQALMRIADKNVALLSRLTDDILDFRRYQEGEAGLRTCRVDVAEQLRSWCGAFEARARAHDIRFAVDTPSYAVYADLDPGKMERVVYNLLSNAFKHTPDNGRVTVSLTLLRDPDAIQITVADDGEGIPSEELPKIFDRFYQADQVRPTGSGIGLAVARAFVRLHGGEITAENAAPRGARFTVTIPLGAEGKEQKAVSGEALAESEVRAAEGLIPTVQELQPAEQEATRPLLLVVDDNEDIYHLIVATLADKYEVIYAPDGQQGLKLAARQVPDAIICDVMMPVMDGMECCRRIKTEVSTSHIPVLMLTACALDDQRIQGYDSGADAYLSKPFNAGVLDARIRNLIASRKRAATPTDGTAEAQATRAGSDSPAADIDDRFYARVLQVMEQNISDPDFSVETLAAEVGLGRSQLYRKIKSLTNYSPVELLRKTRLARAREMLTKTQMTVSEISYAAGFSSPAYFTKSFRDQYGTTPTDLRQSLGM